MRRGRVVSFPTKQIRLSRYTRNTSQRRGRGQNKKDEMAGDTMQAGEEEDEDAGAVGESKQEGVWKKERKKEPCI